MADFRLTARRLGITPGYCLLHNHRLDAAFTGRYILRLPDGTPVAAEHYEARRRAYDAARTHADDEAPR